MSKSGAEMRGRRIASPSHWDPFRSVYLQASGAAACAVIILVGLYIISPVTTGFMIETFEAFLHEAGHRITSYAVQGSLNEIAVRPDSSGHVQMSVTGTLHIILVSGAGMVLPAWIGALLMVVSVTRVGIEAVMAIIALAVAGLTYFAVTSEPGVTLALFGVAALAFLTALLPAGGFAKAVISFLFAFAIGKGLLDTIDYAYVEWIDGDPERPSDSMQIAMALELSGVEEVAETLIALIAGGYFIAMIICLNWLQRHSR